MKVEVPCYVEHHTDVDEIHESVDECCNTITVNQIHQSVCESKHVINHHREVQYPEKAQHYTTVYEEIPVPTAGETKYSEYDKIVEQPVPGKLITKDFYTECADHKCQPQHPPYERRNEVAQETEVCHTVERRVEHPER